MTVPPSLQHRIDLFRETGRVFRSPNELFGEASWTAVMFGQGLEPEQYHPIVNMMEEKELEEFLKGIESSVGNMVRSLPEHRIHRQLLQGARLVEPVLSTSGPGVSTDTNSTTMRLRLINLTTLVGVKSN